MQARTLVLIAGVWVALGAWAQIPVMDTTAITNAQAVHLESIAKYIEQIQHMPLSLCFA